MSDQELHPLPDNSKTTRPNSNKDREGVVEQKPILVRIVRRGLNFIETQTNTTVITALITALLGPIAVIQVSRYMENKEIQRKVVEKVLDITDGQDFSKVQALEKIELLASIVDENEDIFGLTFDSTLRNIRSMKQFGYSNLNTELEKNQFKIDDLSKEIQRDTAAIRVAQNDIKHLMRQKSTLESLKNRAAGDKKLLATQIAEKEQEIRTRNGELNEMKIASSRLDLEYKVLESSHRSLQESLKKAEKNFNDSEVEKKELNKKLESNTKLLAVESADKAQLQTALRTTTEELKMASRDKDLLRAEINNSKLENNKLANQVATLEKEIQRLRDEAHNLQVNPEKIFGIKP